MSDTTHKFRVNFMVAGNHVHCKLYSCKLPGSTYEKLGEFVVGRGQELLDLYTTFDCEFVTNDPTWAGMVCEISSEDPSPKEVTRYDEPDF